MRLMLAAVLLSGCLAAPTVGEVVEPGVGRALFETRMAGTDLIPVTVIYPATSDAKVSGTALPAVVFIQGGGVATKRYEWQARALARAGYVVAIPENALQLAFFSIDAGKAARGLLVSPPKGTLLEGTVDSARIGVAGHSLGSVVAMKLALSNDFAAVALEAGFPDSADDAQLPAFTRPSLSLAGALDCSAKLDDVKAGWAKLSSPTALSVLEGVTHYQFTDSQSEDDQKDCTPGVTINEAHARIEQSLLGFFNAALTDATVGHPALEAVPAATVEAR